ncbi:Uncharacterised protein [Mycobacterium tuberculosis]|nr:Uncharacterised protein [Mycobacterium tuberculosis]
MVRGIDLYFIGQGSVYFLHFYTVKRPVNLLQSNGFRLVQRNSGVLVGLFERGLLRLGWLLSLCGICWFHFQGNELQNLSRMSICTDLIDPVRSL